MDLMNFNPSDVPASDATELAQTLVGINANNVQTLSNVVLTPTLDMVESHETNLANIYHPLVLDVGRKVRTNERTLNKVIEVAENTAISQVASNHGKVQNITERMNATRNPVVTVSDTTGPMRPRGESVVGGTALSVSGTVDLDSPGPGMAGAVSELSDPILNKPQRPVSPRPGFSKPILGIEPDAGTTRPTNPGIAGGDSVYVPTPNKPTQPFRPLKPLLGVEEDTFDRPQGYGGGVLEPLPDDALSNKPVTNPAIPTPDNTLTHPLPGGCQIQQPPPMPSVLCPEGFHWVYDPAAKKWKCKSDVEPIKPGQCPIPEVPCPEGTEWQQVNGVWQCNPKPPPPKPADPVSCQDIIDKIQFTIPLSCHQMPDSLIKTMKDCGFDICADEVPPDAGDITEVSAQWGELLPIVEEDFDWSYEEFDEEW